MHQPLHPLSDHVPFQCHFRAAGFVQTNPFCVIVHAAAGLSRQRMASAAGSVFFFQEVRLFPGRMLFRKIPGDSLPAAVHVVALCQRRVNFVLGNKRRGRCFQQIGRIDVSRKFQLLQPFQQRSRGMKLEAEQRRIPLIGSRKTLHFCLKLPSSLRLG